MEYKSKLYFLHSPKIRQRAKAIALGGLCLYLLYIFNPFKFSLYDRNTAIFLWVFNAFFVLALVGVWFVWRSADDLEEAVLPDSSKWMGPNKIPRSKQIFYLILSSTLIVYAVYGLSINDVYIPGKRGSGQHFHGVSAWFVAGAILSAAANLISVVVDHFDRRNNEIQYANFAAFCEWLAAVLFVMGWIFL